jgi:hypothetical protein
MPCVCLVVAGNRRTHSQGVTSSRGCAPIPKPHNHPGWHFPATEHRLWGSIRYEPADRLWFVALSGLIPRCRWHDVFPVTPATAITWHRTFIAAKWDSPHAAHLSVAPPPRAAIKKPIVRLTKEKPRWGHRRIQGELARLGPPVDSSTVWKIPTSAGVDPLRAVPAQPCDSSSPTKPRASSQSTSSTWTPSSAPDSMHRPSSTTATGGDTSPQSPPRRSTSSKSRPGHHG